MDVGHPCVLIQAYLTTWARWALNLSFVGGWKWLGNIPFRRNCILNSDEKKCLTIDQPGSGWSIFIYLFILKCVLIQYFCSLKTPVCMAQDDDHFRQTLGLCSAPEKRLTREAKPKLSGRHGENRRQGTCCLSEWTCSSFSFPKRSERHLKWSKHQVPIGILHSCRFGGLGCLVALGFPSVSWSNPLVASKTWYPAFHLWLAKVQYPSPTNLLSRPPWSWLEGNF